MTPMLPETLIRIWLVEARGVMATDRPVLAYDAVALLTPLVSVACCTLLGGSHARVPLPWLTRMSPAEPEVDGKVKAYEVTVAGADTVRVPDAEPLRRSDVFAATVPANVAFCDVSIVRAVIAFVLSAKMFASLVPSVAVAPNVLPPCRKK